MGLRITNRRKKLSVGPSGEEFTILQCELLSKEAARWSEHYAGDLRELTAQFLAKVKSIRSLSTTSIERLTRTAENEIKTQNPAEIQANSPVVTDKLLELL